MPYIKTRTNTTITVEQEQKIKEELGRAISLLGKSESWLMLDFESNCHMFFRGTNGEKIAYIDVKIYGHGTRESFNNMTSEITRIITTNLDIPKENIYISYQEFDNWGNNGVNF